MARGPAVAQPSGLQQVNIQQAQSSIPIIENRKMPQKLGAFYTTKGLMWLIHVLFVATSHHKLILMHSSPAPVYSEHVIQTTPSPTQHSRWVDGLSVGKERGRDCENRIVYSFLKTAVGSNNC